MTTRPTVKAESMPVERTWLGVRGVMARTGRGRVRVLDALASGRARRAAGEPQEAGDLRGYQATDGRSEWSVHVDDVDSWMRNEPPSPS